VVLVYFNNSDNAFENTLNLRILLVDIAVGVTMKCLGIADSATENLHEYFWSPVIPAVGIGNPTKENGNVKTEYCSDPE
jgi:hypothetical protein